MLKCGGDWLSVALIFGTWAEGCCWFGICWVNWVVGVLFGVTVVTGWVFMFVAVGGSLRLEAGSFLLLLFSIKAL